MSTAKLQHGFELIRVSFDVFHGFQKIVRRSQFHSVNLRSRWLVGFDASIRQKYCYWEFCISLCVKDAAKLFRIGDDFLYPHFFGDKPISDIAKNWRV
ncbi:hypothetical protein [Pseudanabaena sp. BC1403]|uniref:hypothetical protein n=1 Tax=Pseudanabaena sp. BC1403 TaxID=2043171 RepID=UPI0015E16F84|nr:hypothetical protein [Pseudanabaena sp. BC1403]